jgi:perosamine synthetase
MANFDNHTEEPVIRFQNQLSQFLGGGECIATNQSRAGLLFALRSIPDIQGNEVIVQSFTYRGVMQAILEAGALPVLVDCSLEDLHATPEMIEDCITDRTRAIIATHLFGIPCEAEEIEHIARERECVLIEDCAQCLGARHRGKIVGSFGDFSTFSFNFEKHMSTGEGGMLVVNNTDYLEKLKMIVVESNRVSILQEKMYVYGLLVTHRCTCRDVYNTYLTAYFGQDLVKKDKGLFRLIETHLQNGTTARQFEEDLHHFIQRKGILLKKKIGKTLHIDALQALAKLVLPNSAKIDNGYLLMNSLRACVGSLNLQDLPAVNRFRNKNAQMYFELLEDNGSFSLPQVASHNETAFLKFNVLNGSKHSIPVISAAAKKKGYELGNFQWSKPFHRIPILNRKVPHDRERLQNSEYVAANILNLPVHCSVREEDIHGIVEFLQQYEN